MTEPNRRLNFTPDEMERIEHARRVVGYDTISLAEFIHQATMQMVDEVEGVDRAMTRHRGMTVLGARSVR